MFFMYMYKKKHNRTFYFLKKWIQVESSSHWQTRAPRAAEATPTVNLEFSIHLTYDFGLWEQVGTRHTGRPQVRGQTTVLTTAPPSHITANMICSFQQWWYFTGGDFSSQYVWKVISRCPMFDAFKSNKALKLFHHHQKQRDNKQWFLLFNQTHKNNFNYKFKTMNNETWASLSNITITNIKL